MVSRNPATIVPSTASWVARAWQVLHDESPVGLAILDRELRYVAVNPALAAINGIPAVMHVGKTLAEVVPGLADAAQRAFSRVVATGVPLVGLDLSGFLADRLGRVRHWQEDVYPVVGDDGTIAGLAVLVREVTDLRRAEREAEARRAAEVDAHRSHLLRRLAATLVTVGDIRQVARSVASLAGETFGADVIVVAAFDGASCEVLAVSGIPDTPQSPWRSPCSVAACPDLWEVLGPAPHVVWWESVAERDRRYPHRGPHFLSGVEGALLVPLLTGGQPIGWIGIGWHQPYQTTSADRELAADVAGLATAAMEWARLLAAERDARGQVERGQRRLALLGEVSAQLAAAGDESEQLNRLARLLTGEFADATTVFLPDAVGVLRRQVVVAADPAGDRRFQAFIGTPMAADDPRVSVWHTGEALIIMAADAGEFARSVGARDDLVDQADQTLGAGCSTIAAPVVARGRRLGLFVAWRNHRRVPFDDEDLRLVTDVGLRAGVAVDNLRLLVGQTHIATRLQATLVPDTLPEIANVELAARYLAADQGIEVGGDFYDVFAIDDGFVLVIGDVAGRGVDAAGLTGIARTALRTLADHLSPPAMLVRLNTLLTGRSAAGFLTLALLIVRPHSGGATIHTWLAGHPHPKLVHPDGSVTDVGICGDLLGILDTVTHHQHTCEAAVGDLLVVYTDGLTEARGPDGLYGSARLDAELARLAGGGAAAVVDGLVRALTDYRGRRSGDDTAILAVRFTAPGVSDPATANTSNRSL